MKPFSLKKDKDIEQDTDNTVSAEAEEQKEHDAPLEEQQEQQGSLSDRIGISFSGLRISSLIRVIAALAVYIFAVVYPLDRLIYILLLIAAILIAGFDIIFASVTAVTRKNFFATELMLTVAAIAVFATGSFREATLLIIIYQLCKTILDCLVVSANGISLKYVSEDRRAEKALLESILSDNDAKSSTMEMTLAPYLDLFTKAAVLAGVLYAAFMPLISDISYVDSIRRCMMVIVASSPLAVLVSMPICMITGISHSAACGVFIKSGRTLEKLAKLNTVILDREDVLTSDLPKLVSYTSAKCDNNTFLKLAALVAYYSNQRIAVPLWKPFEKEVNPYRISEFRELPGSRMEVDVGDTHVELCTREIIDTLRIECPAMAEAEGQLALYMLVNGQYAGALLLEDVVDSGAEDAINDLRAVSGAKLELLSECSSSRTQALAKKYDINTFISECDKGKKIDAIKLTESKLKESDVLMYVTGEKYPIHTVVDIHAMVGIDSEVADMLIAPIEKDVLPISNLPYACLTARRARTVLWENVVFTVFIKLLLIILAFAGVATIWFVALADLVAAMLTVINTTRISDVSIFKKLF